MTLIDFTEQECISGYKSLLNQDHTPDYDLLFGGGIYNIYKASTLKGCCILGSGMNTCLTSLSFHDPVYLAWDKFHLTEEFIFIVNKNLSLHDNYYICLGNNYYEMYDKNNTPTNLNSILNKDILNFIKSDQRIKDVIAPFLEPLILKPVYYEDVKFDFYNIKDLPRRMTFYGKVSFSVTQINELPEELYCENDLKLRYTNVKKLPKILYLGRNLDIKRTSFNSLPDKLRIRNNLNISQTLITYLPEDLWVSDNLTMYECNITKLPDSLHVGGSIYGFSGDWTKTPEFHFAY